MHDAGMHATQLVARSASQPHLKISKASSQTGGSRENEFDVNKQ